MLDDNGNLKVSDFWSKCGRVQASVRLDFCTLLVELLDHLLLAHRLYGDALAGPEVPRIVNLGEGSTSQKPAHLVLPHELHGGIDVEAEKV